MPGVWSLVCWGGLKVPRPHAVCVCTTPFLFVASCGLDMPEPNAAGRSLGGSQLPTLVSSVEQADQWARTLAWVLAKTLGDADPVVRRAVLMSLLQSHVGTRPHLRNVRHESMDGAPPLPQRLQRRLGAWVPDVPTGAWVLGLTRAQS